MAIFIGKFTKDGTNYYFDYSTETRVPSRVMVLDEYREYYGKLHGRIGLSKLPDRLTRADVKGTSAHRKNGLDDMLKGNKAGEGGQELSATQVIDRLLNDRATKTASSS